MNASAMPKAMLRPMLPADAPLLAAIFQDSIGTLTEEDYDAGQRDAWAAAADDPNFAARLQAALTLVATMARSPVGFITLEAQGHISMLYVHPAVARQGIGAMLFDAVAKLAASRGIKTLTVDASDTAKPFFDMKGFEARHRQTVAIGDEWLGNTRMVRAL